MRGNGDSKADTFTKRVLPVNNERNNANIVFIRIFCVRCHAPAPHIHSGKVYGQIILETSGVEQGQI